VGSILGGCRRSGGGGRFSARVAEVGWSEIKRLGYSIDESLRMIDGVSPIMIWRERKKISQREAAARAGIGPSYLAEIETGRKPGSVAAVTALARLFDVPMEQLLTRELSPVLAP
jgi:DNA-binding XRE family transcriptional regulator